MNFFVLMAMPHLNVRAELRELKRKSRNFALDDAVMALPEGLILSWFDAMESEAHYLDSMPLLTRTRSERMQVALAHSESELCGALPDQFRFGSIEKIAGHWVLRLESSVENDTLTAVLREFGAKAGLKPCDPPSPYAAEPLRGIELGSAGDISLPTPVSFKKYELVVYLAELPDAPQNGFQFRAIARVHRKPAKGQRTSQR